MSIPSQAEETPAEKVLRSIMIDALFYPPPALYR
jgi:hypothetical protein